MPLSGNRVLLEQGGDPLLTFGFALAGRLPLSFLQDELLVCGLRLVLVVDGSGHLLPQPDPEAHSQVEKAAEAERSPLWEQTFQTQTRSAPPVGRYIESVCSASALMWGSRKCPLSRSSYR